ncbi:MAG: serine hydrolase [Planctomycetes bacterium]|nr:serine hydrolase [Planctomycetota bacterium]
MRKAALLSLLLPFLTACMTPEEPAPPTALDESVEALCVQHPGTDVCIAYANLDTGRVWMRFGDLVLHAASTMKIAVMYEAFRQHDAGRLDLDAPVEVRNTFESIVDGSPYALAAADDSEKDLYEHVGARLPARELVRRMMVRSSNLATNLMVEILGPKSIQATLTSLGLRDMKVLRGVEDGPAFERGLNNVATARDLMTLLREVHAGRSVTGASRAAMREILLGQEFNDLIPKGVPPDTAVAHKTGSITRIRHDAAIVSPVNGPAYVLVVLTRGFDDRDAAAPVITEVSRLVWMHHHPEADE